MGGLQRDKTACRPPVPATAGTVRQKGMEDLCPGGSSARSRSYTVGTAQVRVHAAAGRHWTSGPGPTGRRDADPLWRTDDAGYVALVRSENTSPSKECSMAKLSNYRSSGVDYSVLDRIKREAIERAKATSGLLAMSGAEEVPESRGASAY